MGRDPPETAWTADEASAAESIEAPVNRALPGHRMEDRWSPCAACHAGGRGFESRRSRKTPCKSACGVVGSDAKHPHSLARGVRPHAPQRRGSPQRG